VAERIEHLTIGDGFRFGLGILWLACVSAFVGAGLSMIDGSFHDSTDAPGQHSGMVLRTDHLTGCQYLGGGSALTPRLDQTGKPMCEGTR
jgi:hypothetical protein